jgi:gamma-glutamylcyclotransferase (GGCT)/AIG2-like uncharacterized protein YtfP
MAEPRTEKFFFYGTLRTGGEQNSMLAGSRCLGEAVVIGTLYHLGAYPALVLVGERRVHGEIWECPVETVAVLDAYEGVGQGLFDRVRVRPEGGEECWVYVPGAGVAANLEAAPVLESGRWE